ncbi:MAG: hypothetical protein AAB254_05720, partial [candidate division NC10 bacterium]
MPGTHACPEPQWATRGTANRFIHLTSLRFRLPSPELEVGCPRVLRESRRENDYFFSSFFAFSSAFSAFFAAFFTAFFTG